MNEDYSNYSLNELFIERESTSTESEPEKYDYLCQLIKEKKKTETYLTDFEQSNQYAEKIFWSRAVLLLFAIATCFKLYLEWPNGFVTYKSGSEIYFSQNPFAFIIVSLLHAAGIAVFIYLTFKKARLLRHGA